MGIVRASHFLLLVGAMSVTAPDAPPAIRFPSPPVVAPMPPAPDAVTVIGADEFYVIDADQELFVLSSPPGLVSITPESGPQKVKARFTGGNGKVETRTFTGKFLYFIEAKGTGAGELIVIPKGVTDDKAIIRKAIAANIAPQPPPKPPTPPPAPVPDAPIPEAGFRVLIVYDTAQVLTAGQESAIFGKTVRDYLDAKCVVGPDGRTKEYRILDKSVQLVGESDLWKKAFARTRSSLPWLIVSNGKSGYEGPLPASVADTMAILKKYGE